MPKQSQAREAAKTAASAKASTASRALPSPESARWGTIWASVILVLAAWAVYHNSFSGPFIFDDQSAIMDNPTIKHLGTALSPPLRATTGGRPLLNLTFALNYALGGLDVRGYHAVNLLIHALAGLTLLGIVRRTLLSPPLRERFGVAELPLALTVAVIWVVHPLQTEAVTYISQRAESLMGLFYLLTLYCFVRSADSPRPVRWQVLSVLACFLGAMSKEIIVTAPITVFLYDRTFITGSFREAWRQRWRYYLGLASTWALHARLMTSMQQRGTGFGEGITWWNYALTSCRSVVLYLKLAVWPHPLVLDYGADFVHHAFDVIPYALILVALAVGIAVALWRWPAVGFVGAWFFMILAPTSSIVPVSLQPTAEHRMYLSLAAMISLVVLGLHALIGKRSFPVCVAVAVGLGWSTIERNKDYRSELAIWNDTVAKRPDNARAHDNLGMAFDDVQRPVEAVAEYETALRLNSSDALAHNNIGGYLLKQPGRVSEAMGHFIAALSIMPDYPEAHNNLGSMLAAIPGRLPDAIAHFEAAVRAKPRFAEAHYNLGSVLERVPGRLPDAISEYEKTLAIKPDFALAQNNLGLLLSNVPGRLPDAIEHLEAAVRLDPTSAEMHYNLGCTLLHVPQRRREALIHFEDAIQIDPKFVQAREMLDRLQAHNAR